MYEQNIMCDITSILKEDTQDIKERVERINSVIEQRETIRNENIKSIDNLILDCKNKMLEIEQNPYLKDSDRLIWEKAALDLEKLKIQEHRNNFIDGLRLKEKLIDGLIEHKQAQRDADLQNMLFDRYEPLNRQY